MTKIQQLPFSVVISRDGGTTARLLATRIRAFDRHDHPVKQSHHFQLQLKSDSGVLITAESKLSGECLGSVRVETNLISPFYFENEISTTDLQENIPSICASRLSVTNATGAALVRLALSKALYLYCHAMQARYVYAFVDSARFRLYRNLGFESVFEGNPDLHLNCHNGVSAKLVRSDVNRLEKNLALSSDSLREFFYDVHHSDIKIFDSVASIAQVRRKSDITNAQENTEPRLMPVPTV
jgi:hypothetical protein